MTTVHIEMIENRLWTLERRLAVLRADPRTPHQELKALGAQAEALKAELLDARRARRLAARRAAA
jgi:hypothetical protein